MPRAVTGDTQPALRRLAASLAAALRSKLQRWRSSAMEVPTKPSLQLRSSSRCRSQRQQLQPRLRLQRQRLPAARVQPTALRPRLPPRGCPESSARVAAWQQQQGVEQPTRPQKSPQIVRGGEVRSEDRCCYRTRGMPGLLATRATLPRLVPATLAQPVPLQQPRAVTPARLASLRQRWLRLRSFRPRRGEAQISEAPPPCR